MILMAAHAAPALAAPEAASEAASSGLAGVPGDPLQSPFLPVVLQLVLPEGAKIRFDDRVKVSFPMIAEDQRQFPVQVDARGIPGAQRIIVFADLNPIQMAVDFTPRDAEPFIALRIKLDQRTPVRAAVQIADGSWLIAGNWIDAAGGGCSAPPASRIKGDWAHNLMQLRGRMWTTAADAGPGGAAAAGTTRLALHVRHPMDTGFVDNISSYWLETLRVTANGRPIADLTLAASVAEDPAIMLMPRLRGDDQVNVAARDSGGLEMAADIARPAPMSPLPFSARLAAPAMP
ncbi:quinoprotein dehydrogenase-associated SoxYZ-like carrier [Sandarakinorhabdus sp.]|uniref:quinoprotein dehydrogenase-associated SoxYZ-like carrier n=1 Tax=Sandarakinorhabdus sp. TaxID=1916663 RepID=UPI003F70857A